MPFFIRSTPGARPVEAAQWFPGQPLAGVGGESAGHLGGGGLLPVPPHAFLHTRKGPLTVFAGDWVITEADGSLHVCQSALFAQSYAALPEQEAASEEVPD